MALSSIQIDRFAHRLGAWMDSAGPESDVVVSCRVRLARNLADAPFISRLEEDRAESLAERLRDVLEAQTTESGPLGESEAVWVDIREASVVARLLLRERHLVSRDLAPIEEQRTVPPGRAVYFTASETASAMVN
ncbi:MAG: hypothetical protein AAFZ65_09405, partial [Planctomycetota bacterium]